jgi:hypothetical protein
MRWWPFWSKLSQDPAGLADTRIESAAGGVEAANRVMAARAKVIASFMSFF